MRELKSIEENILDRALFLIGKKHSLNISVRAIAEEAKVNVSAINYYFRTKEEMMRQIRELYISNTLSISAIMADTALEREEKLITTANEIMEYIIRYPGITVLLRDARERADETSQRILKVSNEMTEGINFLLDQYIGKSEGNLYKRILFWSAINYPVEDNGFTSYDTELLNSRENRISYIRQLLWMLRQQAEPNAIN